MPSATRREARERALSLLYEAEVKGITPKEVLAEQVLDPDPFVIELVEGVGGRLEEIDSVITRYSIDWTLDRMPAVDRNVLRLAVLELMNVEGEPVGAIISEAVELAKSYSTDGSGRFVNGLLAGVAEELRSS